MERYLLLYYVKIKSMIGKTFLKTLLILPLTLLFSIFPTAVFASHQPTTTYDYLIGTGLLCDLPFPNPCPAISMGNTGDKIEITGQGTLSINPKSVTGGGSFVHKDASGNVIGSGSWSADDLIGFRSWGTQPDLPANFEGGRAKIRVHLTPSTGGEGFDGTLRIICAVGDFPSSAEEGVELTLRHAPNFTDIVSGLTLFIRK